MKTDSGLQTDVNAELKWEPLLRSAEIGVSVKDGIVTLTGSVDSYAKKAQAEDAVKRVAGVRAVVEKIDIKHVGSAANKDDGDIAIEAINALKAAWDVPSEKVTVKVEQGWITLGGELEWNYQSDAARQAVRHLLGINGVSNGITIRSRAQDAVETSDIESALNRNWAVSDKDIRVKVTDHRATLTGTVHSWYQKDEAERVAWRAPGVWNVDNALFVEHENE
jgi:osmotically-inducible protein OsmY